MIMDDNNKKDIKVLAETFEQAFNEILPPSLSVSDYLDLMDYYSGFGMVFEAELCRHFAEKTDPENPEVRLTQAHWYADEGNWSEASNCLALSGFSGYDSLLFKVEQQVRCAQPHVAARLAYSALPSSLEVTDYDFLYDCSELFFDYGYALYALFLLSKISNDYVDYAQVQALMVECYAAVCHYPRVKAMLNDMIDKCPFDETLWIRLATCQYRMGRYDECDDSCEYALAITDTDGEAQKLKNYANFDADAVDVFSNEGVTQAYFQQDFTACMVYAGKCYEAGRYDAAAELYRRAGYFCPRGHRERERIVHRLALCLIHLGQYSSANHQLLSLFVLTGSAWNAFYDAAQILFERGNFGYGVTLLKFPVRYGEVVGNRLEQLTLLLHHYECYSVAESLWGHIFKHVDKISSSYQRYLDIAAGKVEPKDAHI